MKRADCVAITDAILRQNKTVLQARRKVIGLEGNFLNVSIATADWKLEITTRSVSLITCMLCIRYINKKTHSMASRI